jgi:hypothetical protein
MDPAPFFSNHGSEEPTTMLTVLSARPTPIPT